MMTMVMVMIVDYGQLWLWYVTVDWCDALYGIVVKDMKTLGDHKEP